MFALIIFISAKSAGLPHALKVLMFSSIRVLKMFYVRTLPTFFI